MRCTWRHHRRHLPPGGGRRALARREGGVWCGAAAFESSTTPHDAIAIPENWGGNMPRSRRVGTMTAHTTMLRRRSFDSDGRSFDVRLAVVVRPRQGDHAALGRNREEGEERIGGDRREQVGAEHLLAVIGADESVDDIA